MDFRRVHYFFCVYLSFLMIVAVQGQTEQSQIVINDLTWSSTSDHLFLATSVGILVYDLDSNSLECFDTCSNDVISNIAINLENTTLAYTIANTSSINFFEINSGMLISEVDMPLEFISTIEFNSQDILAVGGGYYSPDGFLVTNIGLYLVYDYSDNISSMISIANSWQIFDIGFYENIFFVSTMTSSANPQVGDIASYNIDTDELQVDLYLDYVSLPSTVEGDNALILSVGDYEIQNLILLNLITDEIALEIDAGDRIVTAFNFSSDYVIFGDDTGTTWLVGQATEDEIILDDESINVVKSIDISSSIAALVRSVDGLSDTLEIWDIEESILLSEFILSDTIEDN